MSKSQLVHYHGIILHNHAVNNIKNMHSQLYVSVCLCTYVYIISSLNWTSSSYCPIDTVSHTAMYIIISGVFLSSAPEVNPISACPADEDKLWKIQWPAASSGSIQFVRCPGEGDDTEGVCLYKHVTQQ